jgi:phage terminase large subunit
VYAFHTQSKARKSNEYENQMTEGFFILRDLLKEGKVYIPWDRDLIMQLSNRQYFMTKKGKIVLETKDEYKRRGNESPDRADACVYAFYNPAAAGSQRAVRKVS